LWIEIVKGDDIFVAVKNLCGNFAFNDSAEDAIRI